MSKCMVAFIDWYHDNIDGERTKVKVSLSFSLLQVWQNNLALFFITILMMFKRPKSDYDALNELYLDTGLQILLSLLGLRT